MGSNKILNLEKAYDLDPVWSGFNEEYRNIIAKKVGVTKKSCSLVSFFIYSVSI